MKEHKPKLEDRVAALEARVTHLEMGGKESAKDFNPAEDYVRNSRTRKYFRKAQEEDQLRTILGG